MEALTWNSTMLKFGCGVTPFNLTQLLDIFFSILGNEKIVRMQLFRIVSVLIILPVRMLVSGV